MALRARMLLISLVMMTSLCRAAAQAPPGQPLPPLPPPGQTPPGSPGQTFPAPMPTATPQSDAPKKPQLPPPPPANAVAANVNGQDIPELAVYRAFMHDPGSYNADNRKDLINHLVDNVLVDQYLSQLKIQVDPKEVESRFATIEGEATKAKSSLKEMLGRMYLTEDDLRKELLNALRWEKFLLQQATDKVLRDMFDKNPSMFDGTTMAARHILIPNKGAESLATIQNLRKHIDAGIAAELAKLPATADAAVREKERLAATVRVFAFYAEKYSTCPSSKKGGELGAFPRIGAMVEPFAKAAFALKPYQMSDPVATEFGYHIILCTEIRPGREVKFDGIRTFVQDVYGDRLREAVIAAYKPRSKIIVNEAK
jgi:peptidyl-prolyl cis-trans isomerase C